MSDAKTRSKPWYARYPELRASLQERREAYERRCETLGIDPKQVKSEIFLDIISRAVHESNWQEGLYLEDQQTREITESVFQEISDIDTPQIDMDSILVAHKKNIMNMKRQKVSVESIATYNLSFAHRLMLYMSIEFIYYNAAYHKRRAMNGTIEALYVRLLIAFYRTSIEMGIVNGNNSHIFNEILDSNVKGNISDEEFNRISHLFELVRKNVHLPENVADIFDYIQHVYQMFRHQTSLDEIITFLKNEVGQISKYINIDEEMAVFQKIHDSFLNEASLALPYTSDVVNRGKLAEKLHNFDLSRLKNPIHLGHIHFLHSIIMMGILPSDKRGRFRKTPVHIIGVDIYFPPPSAVQRMMELFCDSFPIEEIASRLEVLEGQEIDIIKLSADYSYRFVRIHPYADGNGRLSRLLMNLILTTFYPPVAIKADTKSRKRYGYALRRANRDDIEPLASLITMSLIETYDKLLDAIQ